MLEEAFRRRGLSYEIVVELDSMDMIKRYVALRLYDSDNSSITLVACVPRLVYDNRLLVTAELVGVKS